ncbi:MAG: hypothetical protein QME62_13855 [Armatimonadota bacterium]|nr:hypothetical protein [Armatimonadota bacterium]
MKKIKNNLNGMVMDYYRDAMLPALESRIKHFGAQTPGNTAFSFDMPLPLKNGHLAILHDTKLSHILIPKQMKEAEDETMALADLEKFVRDEGHAYIHLKSPLLTRLHLPRPNGDTVRALCTSKDMGCSGIRIHLPSRMDLRPGVALDLDLFVNKKNNPIAVRGIVSKIEHTCEEEIVRCAIDIRFGPLSADALRKITKYVRSQT